MTRETKIGLLVGLAFIIVIGILLSDHLTNTNEPQQASLTGAGNTVRQAVSTPGGAGNSAPVVIVTPPVTPQQTVATQGELTKVTPAVRDIHIGGPTVGQNAGATAGTEQPQQQPAPAPTPNTNKADDNVVTPPTHDVVARNDQPRNVTDAELEKVAKQNGVELVDANQPTQPDATKTYTAKPGDSVSKVVGKTMGSSNKNNIAAFLKANPSMNGDATKFFAGQTYNIPAVSAAATPAPAPTPADDNTVDAPPAKAVARTDSNSDSDDVIKESKVAKTAADTTYVYTVKAGDNLTKIARDQLGDPRAVASIQELNTDKLKGAKHDVVLVGMKLKLPGKPVAKAE